MKQSEKEMNGCLVMVGMIFVLCAVGSLFGREAVALALGIMFFVLGIMNGIIETIKNK